MPRKESFKVKPNTEIKKNLPVRLPIGLHKKLKIYAAKQDKTMVEIIIEQIEKLPLN
jgi:predicted HicB family RNase H-like nuclease